MSPPARAAEGTTLGEFLRLSTVQLAAKGCPSPRVDAEHLVAHVLGLDRIGLSLHLDRPLDRDELARARELVARRARREPLQHILGEWGFRRLTLTVDARALIPRPETEIVVERCLALLAGIEAPRLLDVGVGSGAIALAVADEHRGARVTGADISSDALALARENALRTGLELELVEADLRVGLPAGPWELVVSNPPYVHPDERRSLAPEVAAWDPEAALFGVGLHRVVAGHAREVLEPGGWLVLEVGDGQAVAVAASLRELGFEDVVTTCDLAGVERVVEGRRP